MIARTRLEFADIAVGVVLLGVAAWFVLRAREIPDYSGGGIGSADFPRGLAVLLGLAALFLLANAARRLALGGARHWVTVARPLNVLIGAALLVAFPALVGWIGYYPVMAVWLAAFLWLADYRNPLWIAVCVAGFLLFTKVVFETILKTPIP